MFNHVRPTDEILHETTRMPILLVFLLTAACLPVPWTDPFGLGPRASVGLTAAAVLLPLVAAFTLRTWVVRTLSRQPGRKVDVGNGYLRLRRLLFFVNLGAVGLAVVGLGWGKTARESLMIAWDSATILAPFAELAVPLPYFLIVFGCWLIYYDAERMLHLPASAGTKSTFWSRAGYFLHHLRQLTLLIGFPIGLFVTQQSLTRLAPELTGDDVYRVASVAAVPVLIVFLPLLIKPLLGLRSLPSGPTRDRLEALARRLRFRYSDLLVWPTHASVANAMIVGLVPRVRYVIFTDRVLEEMPADELDAVFGHEVGHARHGHIWYYALFLVLSMTVLVATLLTVEMKLRAIPNEDPSFTPAPFSPENPGWELLPPFALAAGYIFLVFGFLSRLCERQADVFGCRAVSCGNPDCNGHDVTTAYPADGTGLCPSGIKTFARALERVDLLNGHGDPETARPNPSFGGWIREFLGWVRAWQHSTMPRRIGFLLSLIDDRGRERRFQRRLLVLRWGLVVGLVSALVVLGEVVGWRELLAVM
jgi:Zn-dependent protease with chaperone function